MKSWAWCMALGGIMVGASTISIVQKITLGVHFVCDSTFVKTRQEKKHATPLQEYLRIFLSAVELYLRESKCPKIKLVLTGVYNTTGTDAVVVHMMPQEIQFGDAKVAFGRIEDDTVVVEAREELSEVVLMSFACFAEDEDSSM
uniref:Putative gag-pol polyprotein n=1 Tax=Ixodes ricinus TaxID=34613 RepID=A0A0K8R9Q4_IXORI